MDLQRIRAKDNDQRSDDERITWRYTKFLVERIVPGDRVVIQIEQPLQRFLIGEVVVPGYSFSPGSLTDFNHLLSIKPLTPDPIPVNSKAVTAALKHDLSKRGQYYEIYPERSIRELDVIVEQISAHKLDLTTTRTDSDTMDQTLNDAKRHIIEEISRRWPSKDFERFCEFLCEKVDYIEAKERRDSGKGWDLLIRIINPLTQEVLLDDVPVQCKNLSGEVLTHGPIHDLERCIKNSESPVVYLFILGHLTNDFLQALRRSEESLREEFHRPVSFQLVDEDRIAELYTTFLMGKTGEPA